MLAAGAAGAFPVGDAFQDSQDVPKPFMFNDPNVRASTGQYPSLNPNLTDEINEPHPFPEYLNKFRTNGGMPRYYRELLEVAPVDQIQSKIFDASAFQSVRRIGVVIFENKVRQPIRDENIGSQIANQFSQELLAVKKYSVLPPSQMEGDVHMRIVRSPVTATKGQLDASPAKTESQYEFPYSSDKLDAVIIGAVTQYTDHYKNRQGESAKSLTAGVEFGAYLISTKTGEAIWGARFVGTQHPSLANLIKGRFQALNKQELSRWAVKQIVRDLYKLPQ